MKALPAALHAGPASAAWDVSVLSPQPILSPVRLVADATTFLHVDVHKRPSHTVHNGPRLYRQASGLPASCSGCQAAEMDPQEPRAGSLWMQWLAAGKADLLQGSAFDWAASSR